MTDERQRLAEVIGGNVSRETFDRLKALQATVERWNERINLIAPSTSGHIWERHVLDSAQLLRYAPADATWLDLGSGSGFPGLVIAAFQAERSGTIHLVESNRKKAAYLRATSASLALPAKVWPVRIEHMPRIDADVVSARALAPLDQLLKLASPWLEQGSKGLFHKGRENAEEIDATLPLWSFDLIRHASAVRSDGVILEITAVKPR